MFIELVDALRCPRPHEESWLVLSADRFEARHVREGSLGCPVCRSVYPIRDGIVDLRVGDVAAPSPSDAARRAPSGDVAGVGAEALAAMLDLGDPLGFAVLIGEWGRAAPGLLELEQLPPLLLVDPPDGLEMIPGISGLRSGDVLPLAAGAARATAIDSADATRLASAVHATRAGGRVVGPALAPVPDGVRELVRDDTVWVGEREAPPAALVRLHVRRG